MLCTCPNKRLTCVSLLVFGMSAMYYEFYADAFEPFIFYIVMLLFSFIGCLIGPIRYRLVYFINVLFQYIVAFDAIIYPTTKTYLFQAYPYVMIVINLLILWSLSKEIHNVNKVGHRFSFSSNWFINLFNGENALPHESQARGA